MLDFDDDFVFIPSDHFKRPLLLQIITILLANCMHLLLFRVFQVSKCSFKSISILYFVFHDVQLAKEEGGHLTRGRIMMRVRGTYTTTIRIRFGMTIERHVRDRTFIMYHFLVIVSRNNQDIYRRNATTIK